MTDVELKPCPFCGSDRITVWNIRDGQQALCKDCKSLGTPTYHGPGRADNPRDTWERAVAAWNTRALSPAAVTVKPLEWEWPNEYGLVCRAVTPIGTYSVSDDEDRPSAMFCYLHLTDDGDCTRYAVKVVDDYLEPEEAQAAAQADYERRILSAITPAPEAGWRGIPISTNERLPEKPGKRSYEHVRCLIFIHGKWEVGMWNCEHLVWDDDEGDDFRYHPTEPTHWMPLPPAPGEPATEQPTRTQQKSFTVALGKSLTIEQPDAVQEARDAVIHEADFLLDRLKQYEADGCQCSRSVREWCGHVSPPMARLEAALRALSGQDTTGEDVT